MPLACDLEESLTELFAIAATGLDFTGETFVS